MITQKDRWAAKAEKRRAWAEAADARADALTANRCRDHAFLTQPGHIPARAREIARDDRAHELRAKAAQHRAKASNLDAMASRSAGDAEKAHQAARDAISITVQPGSLVSSVYGVREVLKVNAKTLRLKGNLGPIIIDKSLCALV